MYKNFTEIIADNLLNLGKDVDIKVQETFRTSNRHEQKRTSRHHIIIKMPSLQNKNIEHCQRKMPGYKANPLESHLITPVSRISKS